MQISSPLPSSLLPHAGDGAFLARLPVSLFASVMGLSGLALAWRIAHRSMGAPAFVGEAIGALALLVFGLLAVGYLAKLGRHAGLVRAEFGHPVAGNFFGTVAISLLLLSSVIEPYGATAAQTLWTVGVLATFVLGFVAVSRLLKGRLDPSHLMPAWIIPCVATLDIPVTGGHMPMPWVPEINLLACAVGSVWALVLFALIVSRLVHGDPVAPAMRPSLMILVAPFAVGFLAYTTMVGGVDRFAALLFYFALFMFTVLAPTVFRRGAPFSPGWWAIGFPMAALAIAALKYAEVRASLPLWLLAVVLLASLSVALAVLLVRTVLSALNGKRFG